MNTPETQSAVSSMRLLGCIIHPDEKVTATHECESPWNSPYWICGCEHDDCWEYGGTKEQAIYKWNKKQACGDCDPCLGGRPDQCAMQPNEKGELPRPGNEGGAHGKEKNGK